MVEALNPPLTGLAAPAERRLAGCVTEVRTTVCDPAAARMRQGVTAR